MILLCKGFSTSDNDTRSGHAKDVAGLAYVPEVVVLSRFPLGVTRQFIRCMQLINTECYREITKVMIEILKTDAGYPRRAQEDLAA